MWWELGQRWDLPGSAPIVCTPDLGSEALRIFRAVLPVWDRITGA
jgi:hypothetical protein